MNRAFEEALAARLLWVNVVALASTEECQAQTEAAIQAAYDAVHELASNDVLIYRHYGPRAPLMLQDVPVLADQYNLAHELYTELYHTNYLNGSIGSLSAGWLAPAAPLDLPYSKWMSAVTMRMAELMGVSFEQVSAASRDHGRPMLLGWSRGDDVEETAQVVVWYYEEAKDFEEEEAYRKHCEDIADTYASIEADLWAGWREDCEELDQVA